MRSKLLCRYIGILSLLSAATIIIIFHSSYTSTQKQMYENKNGELPNLQSKEKMQDDDRKKESKVSERKSKQKTPVILIWYRQYRSFLLPQSISCGGGCRIVKNRKYTSSANAIIFQSKKMTSVNVGDMPERNERNKNQIFVWFNRESTSTIREKYKLSLRDYNDYFNWSMTYRRDSDVNAMMTPFQGLGVVRKQIFKKSNINSIYETTICIKNTLTATDIQQLISNKTKTSIWAATNCRGTKGAKIRQSIIQKLQNNHMKIDIVGSCGKTKTYLNEEMFYKLLSHYKFYFAFENSHHCRDYITEKVWFNSFYVGLVPIIWGPTREDVENLLPPKSFIFYEDFENDINFINYINHLDNNQTAYLQYFNWRITATCYFPLFNVNDKNIRFDLLSHYNNIMNGFCNLCEKLHESNQSSQLQTISSLHEMWYGAERSECMS